MFSVKDVRCYLCDHFFVAGEEPWLIFNKRLQEPGQKYSSLAESLGNIVGKLIEEGKVHSTFLCDSCYVDVIEYESLERQFKIVRQRIINTFNRNLVLNPPLKGNETPISVDSDEMLFYTNHNGVDKIDKNFLLENGIEDELELVEVVDDDDDDGITEHFTDAIITNNFTENGTAGIVIANAAIETSIERNKLDFVDIPIEYDDLIIYDENIESESIQNNTNDDSQQLQSCKHSEDSSNGLLLYSDRNNPLSVLNNSVELTGRDTHLNSLWLGVEINTNQDRELNINSNKNVNKNINANIEMVSKPVGKLEDGRFICIVCDAPEEYEYEPLLEHLQTCHNIKNYICKVCKQGYSSSDALSKHIALKDSCLVYKCGICKATFENDLLLRLHKRHHFANAALHECPVCHKKCKSRAALQSHMKTHNSLRQFKCMKCNKSFFSKSKLQTHMKVHMERIRQYQCDKCDKAFFSKQNLSQHLKLHAPAGTFVCKTCLKTFPSQDSLKLHMVAHPTRKPFACDICGKAFARRPEMKNHVRTHTGERPFKCDVCSMAFAQRSNLTSHKKSTHLNEKLHKCTQCGRSFKRKRLLCYHILAIHTEERPHKCNVCGAGFVYPEHFKKHMLIHTGRKPYACEVCGKHFNSRDNRNAHRFVHSDKKQYECLECGAGFMRKPLLLYHMNKEKHFNDTIVVNQPQFVSKRDENVKDISDVNIENEELVVYDDNECNDVVNNNISKGNDMALIKTNDTDLAKSNEVLEILNEADYTFADTVDCTDQRSDVNENEIVINI